MELLCRNGVAVPEGVRGAYRQNLVRRVTRPCTSGSRSLARMQSFRLPLVLGRQFQVRHHGSTNDEAMAMLPKLKQYRVGIVAPQLTIAACVAAEFLGSTDRIRVTLFSNEVGFLQQGRDREQGADDASSRCTEEGVFTVSTPWIGERVVDGANTDASSVAAGRGGKLQRPRHFSYALHDWEGRGVYCKDSQKIKAKALLNEFQTFSSGDRQAADGADSEESKVKQVVQLEKAFSKGIAGSLETLLKSQHPCDWLIFAEKADAESFLLYGARRDEDLEDLVEIEKKSGEKANAGRDAKGKAKVEQFSLNKNYGFEVLRRHVPAMQESSVEETTTTAMRLSPKSTSGVAFLKELEPSSDISVRAEDKEKDGSGTLFSDSGGRTDAIDGRDEKTLTVQELEHEIRAGQACASYIWLATDDLLRAEVRKGVDEGTIKEDTPLHASQQGKFQQDARTTGRISNPSSSSAAVKAAA
ncbi:unnamed protein product [Amoebophrya sp. A120]|nr:unnamed protein product [Amoebophrya sp. A120]|eukprot:GSA120T00022659001.1